MAARPLDLVLLGAPGSGKGTQAERLSLHFNVPHISTGRLFRDNMKYETGVGAAAKPYVDKGELVPDEVVNQLVQERLTKPDTRPGFILDGYPRTANQAEALTDMLTLLERPLAGVLSIKVSDEEIVRRLSGRLTCSDCQSSYHVEFKPSISEGLCDACGGALYQRDDDAPATVAARLAAFHRQTEPLIAYYREKQLLVEVPGEADVDQVAARTIAAAEQLARG
jgi:adenylate kinase